MVNKEVLLGRISDIFIQNGLRSTSMDDLCAHLKMSKKTLYQIFNNKNDVVDQVMNFRFEKYRLGLVETAGKSDPVSFLYALKKHVTEDIKNRTYVNVYDLRKYHAEVDERICKRKLEFGNTVLKSALEQGIKDKYFRDDVDFKLQFSLLGVQIILFFDTEYHEKLQMEFSNDEIINTVFKNLMTIIGTPKGIKRYNELSSND